MPRLEKKIPKVFGLTSPEDRLGQVGSLRAGAPTTSRDPAVLQALQNFSDGWPAVVVGNNSPAIEDMNALMYVMTFFTKYLYENGIPELDTLETYYQNAIMSYQGSPVVAIRNEFTPTPVPVVGPLNPTDFASLGKQVQFASLLNESALRNKDIILCNADAVVGDVMDLRVPNCATIPLGKQYIIKNTSTKGSVKKINVNSVTDTFDGEASILLSAEFMNESLTIINNGTGWSIV